MPGLGQLGLRRRSARGTERAKRGSFVLQAPGDGAPLRDTACNGRVGQISAGGTVLIPSSQLLARRIPHLRIGMPISDRPRPRLFGADAFFDQMTSSSCSSAARPHSHSPLRDHAIKTAAPALARSHTLPLRLVQFRAGRVQPLLQVSAPTSSLSRFRLHISPSLRRLLLQVPKLAAPLLQRSFEAWSSSFRPPHRSASAGSADRARPATRAFESTSIRRRLASSSIRHRACPANRSVM